jgi:hypothetical protein
MQEITSRASRNVFATVFIYAFSIFLSKGGFILPFPIYEVLFFILSVYLLANVYSLKTDLSFFIFLTSLSFIWMSCSLISLQLLLPHQWIDSLMDLLPILDIVVILGLCLFTWFKYKTMFKKYLPVYLLFAFLMVTKWGVLLFG